MRVLIIDNNIDRESWGAEDLQRQVRALPGVTFEVRRAPQGDLPASPGDFDRIIVSGSKTSAMDGAQWVESLLEFMRRAIDRGRPLLGVCFGHQMLARALGGVETVGKSAVPEIGWTRIEVRRDSPLLAGLPSEFCSFSWHFEEVKRLPPMFRSLARSPACEVQAMQLDDGRPAYGIQFHPERDVSGAERSFAKLRADGKMKSLDPRAILHPGRSAKLFDSRVGDTIFGNFLKPS